MKVGSVNLYLYLTMYYKSILTMADQSSVSKGAIFNDLERPQTQISTWCHYLMLNISETVRDTDIVTTKGNTNTYRDLRPSQQRHLQWPWPWVILSDFEWRSEIYNDTKHRAVSLRQMSLSLADVQKHIHIYTISPRPELSRNASLIRHIRFNFPNSATTAAPAYLPDKLQRIKAHNSL